MFQSLVPKIGSSDNSEFDLFTVKTFRECELSCIHHVTVTLLSTFAATDALSRQLMCILKWVYSSFSTCNSAVHWHHSR